MTFPTKDELLAGLATVRENICAYRGGRVCDCKYGPKKGEIGSSEHTGCPEVSAAHDLLKTLTWDEYEMLIRRTRGAVTNALGYGSDLAGAHAALDRTGVPKDPSFTLVDRIEKLAARVETKKPESEQVALASLRIGEVFETDGGLRARRVNEPSDRPDCMRVFWFATSNISNMRSDVYVRRVPHETITTVPIPLLLKDLTIGEVFKTMTGRTGVRVEGTGRQSTYLRVEWDDGTTSHEPPSTPVRKVKTMPIANLPALGLFAKLREMGATVTRGAEQDGRPLTIRIEEGPLKLWQSYHRDLASLTSLIGFAKKHVPGPWFVDLEPEDATPLWTALTVTEQHQLRIARPKDAPPGFMFSYCGVDVCEAQP